MRATHGGVGGGLLCRRRYSKMTGNISKSGGGLGARHDTRCCCLAITTIIIYTTSHTDAYAHSVYNHNKCSPSHPKMQHYAKLEDCLSRRGDHRSRSSSEEYTLLTFDLTLSRLCTRLFAACRGSVSRDGKVCRTFELLPRTSGQKCRRHQYSTVSRLSAKIFWIMESVVKTMWRTSDWYSGAKDALLEYRRKMFLPYRTEALSTCTWRQVRINVVAMSCPSGVGSSGPASLCLTILARMTGLVL